MSSTEKPLVSIGIPTYNRADFYLRNALESALNQDYENIEIILSDNASEDSTESLAAEYSCDRLNYIKHKENIGAHNNFNFCLSEARGQYFLLLHDDDAIDPDLVSSCMAALGGDFEVGLARSGTRIIDASSRILKENKNLARDGSFVDLIEDWCNGKSAWYFCSTLFNTEKLKSIGGFQSPHGLYQDVVAELELAAKYGHRNVEGVKASFRRHEDNRGTSSRVMHWQEDSLFLMERASTLAGDSAGNVKKLLQVMLCKKIYRLNQKVDSAFERAVGYFRIYFGFGFCLSPMRYIRQRELRR